MENVFVDYPPLDGCINLEESMGMICVGCNACGRIDKSTQRESALELYKRQLQEQYDFNDWEKENLKKSNKKI